MTRLMLAQRHREANGWYYGISWRAAAVVAVVYVVARML